MRRRDGAGLSASKRLATAASDWGRRRFRSRDNGARSSQALGGGEGWKGEEWIVQQGIT